MPVDQNGGVGQEWTTDVKTQSALRPKSVSPRSTQNASSANIYPVYRFAHAATAA